MRNLTVQITLGLLAAMAAAFGIMARSWGTFFAFAGVFLFFSIWHAASFAAKSKQRYTRLTGLVIGSVCGLAILVSMILTAEQVYFVNADGYPRWLATADLGTIKRSDTALLKLADEHCKTGGGAVYVKGEGLVVIRCSGMGWLGTKTYLAHLETP